MYRSQFARGFSRVCKKAGIDDWESAFPGAEEAYREYAMRPEAFMAGFSSAVKEAQVPQRRRGGSWIENQVDDMSWDKAKKWLIGAGLLALGAGYGSMWGRYANATGNSRGPILGPVLGVRDTIRDAALAGMYPHGDYGRGDATSPEPPESPEV